MFFKYIRNLSDYERFTLLEKGIRLKIFCKNMAGARR